MSQKITYLYEATKVVPRDECGTFIRSKLLSQCRLVSRVNLPAQNFKASIICQGCGIELSEVPPKTKIKSPPKASKLVKKIAKRIESGKNVPLYQRNIYNSFKKKDLQHFITVCKMCTTKNIVKMKKPKFEFVLPKLKAKIKLTNTKKKKKDQFSGLNKAAVLSVMKDSPIKNKVQNSSKSTNNNNNNNTSENNRLEYIPLEKSNISNHDSNSQISNNIPVQVTVRNTNNQKVNKIPVHITNNNKNMRNKNKQNNNPKNKNNIQNGRIEKNQVLKKTEKNINKRDVKLKNLANILKEKPSTSNSLTDFLKNL